MFFHIDCDNFFVSCEKIFQPRLKNKPVIVLSNNDGCVVSRSYEAKALDIKMCTPYFKIQSSFSRQGGVALSSNYELYANISQRVMALLRTEFSQIEIYSIDEAFIKVPDCTPLEPLALHIRNRILKEIGISVSIGIAPTKTLCKIATDIAKKKTTDKIARLTDPTQIANHLKQIDISQIWGIGHNLNAKLNFLGIFNAFELSTSPLKMIRKNFGITIEKTVLELQSFSCLGIQDQETSKTLITSRSFEHEISNFETLEQIASEFTAQACFRLRKQEAVAQNITIFLKTNRFNPNQEQYSNSALITLPAPSSHTAKFITAMKQGLKKIYRPDLQYKSAGVILGEIQPLASLQNDFFQKQDDYQKDNTLMKTIDDINHRFQPKTLYFGSLQKGVRHYIKRDHRSGSYTTSWQDLPIVK